MANDTRGHDREHGDSQLGWVMGAFALGALVGAVTALLLATQSGAETRADLRDGLDDVKKKLGELNEQVKVRGKELAEKGREVLEEKKHVVKSALEAAKKAKSETVGELAAHSEEASEAA